MRWRPKTSPPFPGPAVRRIRRAFLFLPRLDVDGYMRWLEVAKVVDRPVQAQPEDRLLDSRSPGWRWETERIAGRGEDKAKEGLTLLDWLVDEPITRGFPSKA